MPAGVNKLAEPLANELLRREVLPTAQAVEIVQQLAHVIAQRHESGRLHLHIAAETVSYHSDTGQAALGEPLQVASAFGGAESDDEFCPPELHGRSVQISVNLTTARDALRAAGLENVDPRRIDVYQLGALLCRLLTGQSVHDFLSRPRVAAKVPLNARNLIERTLGHDPQHAIRSAEELLVALNTLAASVTQVSSNALPDSPQNPAKPDTTPSFVSVRKSDTDAGQPASTAPQPAGVPFQKLGHYEIVGRLGHGGMGDVYQGYERALDRSVAIKVLPTELARQEDFVLRFRAEATAAAKLSHPNIIQIHFIGEDAGHHFFAMQFIEGESLADLLARRGKLPVEETLAIVEQALAGLAAAHKHGLVHRDIKPGNILLDRKHHRALLADFGLVKSLASPKSGKTATGVIMGTVDYISPEQGRGLAVDGRSDLYSMGVLLFQMLSGRLPFDADNPSALIFQHVYEQPPSLEQVAPDIPVALAAIVDKLLKKSPADRHQTAEEILADLRAVRAELPLSSPTLEPAGVRGERKTAIIHALDFAELPLLPADLMDDRTLGWWQRTKDRTLSLLRRHAPEALQQLQNTQQQVDGAIAEYERRQQKLLPLMKEAETLLVELQAQESAWDTGAVAGDSAAVSREQFRQTIDQQQEQLASMRVRLAQINATLSRLQSQRDLLNARLKVAQVQLQFGGVATLSRFLTPKWSGTFAAQLAVLVVAIGFGAWLIVERITERRSYEPSVTTSTIADAITAPQEDVADTSQPVNSTPPKVDAVAVTGETLPAKVVEFTEKASPNWIFKEAREGTPFWSDREYAFVEIPKEMVGGSLLWRDTGYVGWLEPAVIRATKDCLVYAVLRWRQHGKVEIDEVTFVKFAREGWEEVDGEVTSSVDGPFDWRFKALRKKVRAGDVILQLNNIDYGRRAVLFVFKEDADAARNSKLDAKTATSANRRALPKGAFRSSVAEFTEQASPEWIFKEAKVGTQLWSDRGYVLAELPPEIVGGSLLLRDSEQKSKEWLKAGTITALKDCTAYALIRWKYLGKEEVGEITFTKLLSEGWDEVDGNLNTSFPGGEDWRWKAFSKKVSQGDVVQPLKSVSWRGHPVIFVFK